MKWDDAVFNSDHAATLTDKEPTFGELLEREDVGFLVRADKKEIVLAITRDHSDNSVSYSNTIPRGMVRDIIELVPKPKEEAPNVT